MEIEQSYSAWGPRLAVGEGPIWRPAQQCFTWLDIADGRLFRGSPARPTHTVACDRAAVCIAQHGHDGLLVASTNAIHRLSEPTGRCRILAADPGLVGMRFNDGCLDAAGRFWIGTLPLDGSRDRAMLYLWDERLGLRPVADDLDICNGVGFSPDGRSLYLADTGRRCIYRYTVDPASGALGPRDAFHAFGTQSGKPDGLAVDAAGHVWVAMWDGHGVVELSPAGERVAFRRLAGVPRPTSIAFGGADKRTLLVTTARSDAADAVEATGSNLSWRVETPGL